MEIVAQIALLAFLGLGIPIGLLILKDRFEDARANARWSRTLRDHPEEVPGTPEYLARLDRPQFDEVVQKIGRELPESYRKLYRDGTLSHESGFMLFSPEATDISDACEIQEFLPCDGETLNFWGEFLGPMNVPFATDGGGDPYYIALADADSMDAPVMQFMHDGGYHIEVADSLSEFLSWRRVPLEEIELED